MKKFLSLLATLTIIGSSTVTVVACGNASEKNQEKLFDSVKLKEELRRQMILQLKQDPTLGFDINDLWKNQDIDSIINNIIDDEVSKLYTTDFDNQNTMRLHLANKNRSNFVQYGEQTVASTPEINEVDKEVEQIKQDKTFMYLFTKYTTSLSTSRANALDLKEHEVYGPFNPKVVDNKEQPNVGIYFKNGDAWKRWTSLTDLKEGATRKETTEVGLGNYIPEQTLLSPSADETGPFALVANGVELDLTSLPSADEPDETKPKLIKENISSREAIIYRFQKYFNKESNKNLTELITTQYMTNRMFRIGGRPNPRLGTIPPTETELATNQGVYYNRTDDFQTWSLNGQQENYQTNLKMVWTFSLDDKTQLDKANDLLRSGLDNNGIAQGSSTYATFQNTASLYGLANNRKGNSILQIFKLLSEVSGTAASDVPTTIETVNQLNTSDQGVDPLFGIKGFQGFVKTDGSDVEALIGGDLKVDDEAKKIISQVQGPGVLIQNINATDNKPDFIFNSSESDTKRKDVVVVLPLYLIDLLKTVTNPDSSVPQPTYDNTDPNVVEDYVTGQWVRLLPQVAAENPLNSWKDKLPKIGDNPNWLEVTEDAAVDDEWPTQNSFRNIDGKCYVYLVDQTPTTIKIDAGNGNLQDVNFTFTDKEDWFYQHNFGLDGVGEYSNTPAANTNGRQIKFGIHLGEDTNLPNTNLERWELINGRSEYKRSDDIAYFLDARKKEELMNLLMQIFSEKIASDNFKEDAKKEIYSSSGKLTPESIRYKPLYDRLIKYIRPEETIEESD